MLGIAALAIWLHQRPSLAPIATLTLSVLGLGLTLALIIPGMAPRGLLSVGLAGSDIYFWLALWSLSQYMSPRKVFGWGLGFSLVQIGLATVFDIYSVVQGYSREVFFAFAAAITMLLLPLVFSSRFHLVPAAVRRREAMPPATLTDAETRVFALLARGAVDQEIASELHISRHTVKFHVRNILHKCGVPNRNILHKCGVPNRKVLLSRLQYEPAQNRS